MIQNRPYDYKIDIWALGILLFEMIAGNAPFKGDKP
jgi:serine/threonine protein kinase